MNSAHETPVETVVNPAAKPQFSSAYLTYVMILLAVVNVFNFMDRTVISVLMPSIKAELKFSDTELGLLSGLAFALFYASVGLPLAAFADRTIRRNVVAVALVMWSGMTALCGFAQNFLQLFFARVGVGVGEAGCLPPSHSLIGDYFKAERRSSALAIHTAGSSVGVMIGLMLGGILVREFGWRATFILLGLPGIVLAVIVMLTLKEPKRGGGEVARPAVREGEPRTLIELIRTRPSYLQLIMVFGGGGFVAFGLQQWLPSFYTRSYDMQIADVGLIYGGITGTAATIGAITGGFIGDRLIRRGPFAVLYYSALCYLLAFGFKIAMLLSGTAAQSLAFNFFSSLTGIASHGAIFALVQAVTPHNLRSRAAALLTLFTALIGTGAGPLFIGWISDLYFPSVGNESLRYGLLWCSGLALWPLLHLWLSKRWIKKDMGLVT